MKRKRYRMRGGVQRQGRETFSLYLGPKEWVTVRAKSHHEAKALRDAMMTKRRDGDYVAPSKMTVRDWLTEWHRKYIASTKRRRTVAVYDEIIRKTLIPALGSLKLQGLKAADVQHVIAKATADGYGGATVRQWLGVLSGALRAAMANNLVTHNVVGRVTDKPRVPKPTARVKANTLTASEARTLLAEAAKHGAQVHAYYAVRLSTGMRSAEASGLLWEHVDLDKGTVTVTQELDLPEKDGDVVFGPTKCADTRVINIGADVVALLRAHRLEQNQLKMRNRRVYKDYGLVFARERIHLTEEWHRLGHPVCLATRGPARLDRLTKAADVKRISPHGLRDTCASLLAANGIPLKVISERLGHARAAMTLDRYISVLPGAQEQAGETLNALLHG